MFWAIPLIWLLVISGCTERQFVRPTPQMDIEPQFWVKVLLLDDTKECIMTFPSSFSIIDAKLQTTQTHFEKSGTPIKINISGGKFNIADRHFEANELIIAPDHPFIFNLNSRDYRGKLKLILNPDGKSFEAVNLVPLEPYLAGVIGAEMPDYWEPAALKAQTIAARTYCLYIKKHFGSKRSWDVKKTQANQTYHGISAESARIWQVVNKTYGQVLTCKLSDGTKDIFPTYYSTVCGGHTEDSRNVFGGDFFEPLSGVPCPYCKRTAKPAFFFWPTVQFDKTDVSTKLLKRYPSLKPLGKITNISTAKQSTYKGGKFSRLTSIKLLGSTGKTDSLRAEDLRLTIDSSGRKLKSTACKIVDMGENWAFTSGKGFGHGVGMCQCGTQAMARKGKTTKQILSYYYPSSKIIKVY